MTSLPPDEQEPVTFYIGQHEPLRDYAVTDEVVRHALDDCNYDMLTAPITTKTFFSRVQTLILSYLNKSQSLDLPLLVEPASTSFDIFPILPTLGPQDSDIVPSSNISQLVLTTSPWIDLASPDPLIADVSRQVLQLEVQYAAFCGANNLIISGPRMPKGRCPLEGLSQYARAILEALRSGPYVQIQISLPFSSASEDSDHYKDAQDLASYARSNYHWSLSTEDGSAQDSFHSWDVWNTIRSVCKYNSRLSLALTISNNLPPLSLQSRWYSEPIRILHFPGNTFRQSNLNDAFLSPQHRQILFQYMRLRHIPWILLSDVGTLQRPELTNAASEATLLVSTSDPTPSEAAEMSAGTSSRSASSMSHLRYLRHLQTQAPLRRPIERFGAGYQDFLQNPLQPLSDNLESITYEVFEKDPVKYEWYENAITCALKDWKAMSKPTSGRDGRVALAVVGAGRGPLISRALVASSKAGVELDLWAIEKNPNAFVLLQRYNKEKWNSKVNLVQSDMRSWTGPFVSQIHLDGSLTEENLNVDILVSELLGSFGDNELSPECLDGVQHLLNPTGGISIPSSYTAHLTPLAAPKLHADIQARALLGDLEAHQTPYVVLLQSVDILSTHINQRAQLKTPQSFERVSKNIPVPVIHKAWEFSHPSPVARSQRQLLSYNNQHNRRFSTMSFECRNRGTCHGLGGYFEAVLYDSGAANRSTNGSATPNQGQVKIELSTNPLTMETKSKDMISWFPIYFPLKTPLYFPDNSLLTVSMWRQTDGRKVWYEWMVESFMLLDFGSDGMQKLERLSVTDLHSSAANGCLL